jgi:hypothetical protein
VHLLAKEIWLLPKMRGATIKSFTIRYMFIWSSLTMTYTTTPQNIDFSFWIALYVSSNITPNFYCLHHFKRSVRVRACLFHFVNMLLYLRWGFGSFSPNPQAGRPPLVVCTRLPEHHYIVIELYKVCLCNRLSKGSQWGRDGVFKRLLLASRFEEARGKFFCKYFAFSLSLTFRHCSLLTVILILFFLLEQAGEVWELGKHCIGSTFT